MERKAIIKNVLLIVWALVITAMAVFLIVKICQGIDFYFDAIEAYNGALLDSTRTDIESIKDLHAYVSNLIAIHFICMVFVFAIYSSFVILLTLKILPFFKSLLAKHRINPPTV